MDITYYIDEIDCLNREQDSIFHNLAVHLKTSDSVLCVLYNLTHMDGCTQQELCSRCFFPKQTINTAVLSLAKRGYVTLETIPGTRNLKKILLTDAGHELLRDKIEPILAAERRAYRSLSDEELDACLKAISKLTDALKTEFGKLTNQI